ncbi:MAG: hypothetical protein ACREN5_11600 [Gemmatimonadales bacterium]
MNEPASARRSRTSRLATPRKLRPSDVVAIVIGVAFGLSALLVASGLFIRLAFSP